MYRFADFRNLSLLCEMTYHIPTHYTHGIKHVSRFYVFVGVLCCCSKLYKATAHDRQCNKIEYLLIMSLVAQPLPWPTAWPGQSCGHFWLMVKQLNKVLVGPSLGNPAPHPDHMFIASYNPTGPASVVTLCCSNVCHADDGEMKKTRKLWWQW